MRCIPISSKNYDDSLTPGAKKIISFLNEDLDVNKPVDIHEIVDQTDLSWTYVKKILEKFKEEKYVGFHFEKLGNSWIIWKDRKHVIKQPKNTCGRFLED